MNRQQLIDEIHTAFRNVQLEDGIGLWEGQGLDDYADAEILRELKKKDERDDWNSIPFETLNLCSSSLYFFDPKGMRFHLPLFMICELMEADSPGIFHDFDVLYHLENGVSDTYHGENQFCLFNKQQLLCIIHFIEFTLLSVIEQHKEYEKTYSTSANAVYSDPEYIKINKLAEKWRELL